MSLINLKLSPNRVFIIAEVGSNHGGTLSKAKEHIDAARECGADAVKFQSLNAKKLYIEPSQNIQDLHALIDLEEEWHQELKSYADKKKIIFCSSPTYLEAVDILINISVDFFKIASAQIGTFPQLISSIASTGKPTLLSTGIATYGDISNAINIFESLGNKNYAILHCNSQYPTPPENVYLGRIDTYKKMFGCPVGFSDHTTGTCVALAAVAKGADIIEKHFKIDDKCISPDASFSILPASFREMVANIKSVKDACADKPRIFLEETESSFRESIRYRLVLKNTKGPGDEFDSSDFDFLRTDNGIDVSHFNLVINNFRAASPLPAKTILTWANLKGK